MRKTIVNKGVKTMTQAQEKRMNELQKILREASDAYYNDEEIMTNREYDELYDELVALEEETGVIYPDSMTQIAGAEAVDELPKVKHEYPSLSLAKTKVPSDLVKQMIKNPKCNQSVMMWKADGSTVVATYDNGRLTRLVTRGNGEVGSEITHNAPYIKGLPMAIPCKDHIVVRGEAVMTYTEFERINNELPVGVEKYKNPRNLANSTISLLDPNEMKEREIQFLGFNFVARIDEASGMDIRYDDFANRMKELETFGFQTVEWELVDNSNIESTVTKWTNKVEMIDFPVDGLVIASNDASYAEKQPGTGHNPNNLVGFAFKWEDELVQTHLRDIEWSVGRTGLITPVAIFDPVEICSTTVSRASMHNLSEMGRILDTPYIGQEISVYKANMIIPQVDHGVPMDVVPMDVTTIDHPLSCPCCKTDVTVKESKGGVKTLVCENDDCPSKMIGKLEHFCKRA
jgi:DNA ligase (NAD+)